MAQMHNIMRQSLPGLDKVHLITKAMVTTKKLFGVFILVIAGFCNNVVAQDEDEGPKIERPAFESAQFIDNHSSLVYDKGTLEMNMQHRFGLIDNGISDVFGIYGPANIRIGMAYAPINRLNVGFGYTKNKQYLDLNGKYALIQQTRDLERNSPMSPIL